MTLDELVTQLCAGYGTALRAIVLYGSAVAGEHIAKQSDYNVLVIVDDVPLDRLRALSATARAWRDSGNPAPMTFTEREWRTSADVFPMEYADILERHKVLYGEPPFEGITVDPEDLRLQVEHEALGVLLRLRAAVLVAGNDSAEQLKLLAASLSSLMIVFRGVLRLHGKVPPQNYAEVANEVASVTGADAAPFLEVVQHVRGAGAKGAGEKGGRAIPKESASATLGAYLRSMEAVVMHLDSLPKPPHKYH